MPVTANTDVPPTQGGDEGLTMAEFLESYPEATEGSFVEADLNSDGVIDNAELLAATEAGLILPVENTAPVGTGVTSVTTTAPDMNIGSEPDVPPTRGADEGLRMAEFLAEYPNATEETYVEADLDADGRIDNSEILAAIEAGLILAKAD
jgi:Ca2+-binding EF-hand superfamily protein